jgi:hypothetical protein
MHVGPAAQAGVSVEQVQDVLATVAPVIGAPRVFAAAQNITEAPGADGGWETGDGHRDRRLRVPSGS